MRFTNRTLKAASLIAAWAFAVGLSALSLCAQDAASDAAPLLDTIVPITAHRTDVEIIEKFAKVLETKARIVRVDGFDPVVLDVRALTPNRIRIIGLLQGVTNVEITDENGATFSVEVFVKGDARTLQAIIDRKFPNSSIEAFKVQDAVVLRGWVTQPEHITQIVEIAEQYYQRVLNQMRVGGVQQVLLKVKVMEAQRSVIRQLGMNLTYFNQNGYLTSNPGSISSTAAAVPLGGPPTVATVANNLLTTASFGIVGNNNSFQSYITALRDESLLKIRAEPEVVATNGRAATLLSGGEFPIIVPQSLGTVSIQYREFGVRLEATPFVLGSGSLRLELQPEVSDRDDAHGVIINGTSVPALTVRRVNTQVELKFGQTLMLAGLISTRQQASAQKIPVLGELPYLGTAFSRKRFDDIETEVVITVTPELVAPLDESQVPLHGPGQFTDTPNSREFGVYGLLEVPKYGDRCLTCPPANAGPYIVPGLRDSPKVRPAVEPTKVPLPVEREDLILPPPAQRDEQSLRTRRNNTQIAQPRTKDSAVRNVAFDDRPPAATNAARPADETRVRETPRPNSTPIVPEAQPRAATQRPITNTSKADNTKAATAPIPATKSTTVGRDKKPGLIEPASK